METCNGAQIVQNFYEDNFAVVADPNWQHGKIQNKT